MNTIGTNFSSGRYRSYMDKTAHMQRMEKEMANSLESLMSSSEKTSGTSTVDSSVTLSDKAKSVLEALQSKYGSVDFYVQNFSDSDQASSILSGSSQEISVLISPDQLEKMADNESYMQEKMTNIDEAINMYDQISRELPMVSGYENTLIRDDISRIGIAFDSSGKMSLFADLEKSSVYRGQSSTSSSSAVKKTTLTASSVSDLMSQLRSFNWIQAEDTAASFWFDLNV